MNKSSVEAVDEAQKKQKEAEKKARTIEYQFNKAQEDGKMYGSVLTALHQDFGVKEKDTIYFGMTEMEDHKLACVWVKEDE